MAFAIVHFTVGFVVVLAALWLLPITRYRLTGAFLGGVLALVPDLHHLFGDELGERLNEFHDSSSADLFFLHSTLDQPVFRENGVELTFLALVSLGAAFLLYDWRFGRRSPTATLFGSSSSESTDPEQERL